MFQYIRPDKPHNASVPANFPASGRYFVGNPAVFFHSTAPYIPKMHWDPGNRKQVQSQEWSFSVLPEAELLFEAAFVSHNQTAGSRTIAETVR